MKKTLTPLLIASSNQGKVAEIYLRFPSLPYQLLSLNDLPQKPQPPAETGNTYEENALLKARYYAHHTGMVTLSDDSGLSIAALNGQPGVKSARFGQSDAERIEKVLTLLGSKPMPERKAQFICVIVIYNPRSQTFSTHQGYIDGWITHAPVGSHGFGYDPIFALSPDGPTFAQIPTVEKNKLSHRAKALDSTFTYLQTHPLIID